MVAVGLAKRLDSPAVGLNGVVDVLDGRRPDHQHGRAQLSALVTLRYGTSNGYREIKKTADLQYLTDSQLIMLGEDADLYNRNARDLLEERLKLRNRCGHPTGYVPGRGEVVVFIESLLINVVGGAMLNW